MPENKVIVKCAGCRKPFVRYRVQIRKSNFCTRQCFLESRQDTHLKRVRARDLRDGERITTSINMSKETLAKLERLEGYYERENRSYVIERLIEQKYTVLQNKEAMPHL